MPSCRSSGGASGGSAPSSRRRAPRASRSIAGAGAAVLSPGPRYAPAPGVLGPLGAGTLPGCDDQTAVEQRLENARALVQQGDTRRAIAELKHALQQTPEDADLRLMLGKL